jgi:hypothetical protein
MVVISITCVCRVANRYIPNPQLVKAQYEIVVACDVRLKTEESCQYL